MEPELSIIARAVPVIILMAVVFGCTVWLKRRARVGPGPRGIGGWLLFLAILQLLGGVLCLIGILHRVLQYRAVASVLPYGKLFISVDVALQIVALGLFACATFLLFTEKRTFRRWFFIQNAAFPVLGVIEAVLVRVLLGELSPEWQSAAEARVIGGLIFLYAATSYVNHSRRVSNTMVN